MISTIIDATQEKECSPHADIPDSPACECWAPWCVCDQLRDEDRDDWNEGFCDDGDLGLEDDFDE